MSLLISKISLSLIIFQLFDRIVEKEHYSEKEAADTIRPLVDAIRYCHGMNIIHRDLKVRSIKIPCISKLVHYSQKIYYTQLKTEIQSSKFQILGLLVFSIMNLHLLLAELQTMQRLKSLTEMVMEKKLTTGVQVLYFTFCKNILFINLIGYVGFLPFMTRAIKSYLR